MSSSTPPIEAQRFGRSQTPESPRPLHAPQPSSIPVLNNQMDPVFNDTATYNIPSNNPFSPSSEHHRTFPDSSAEDHDPVQSFFRGAEAESSLSRELTKVDQSDTTTQATTTHPTEPSSLSLPADHTNLLSPSAASELPGSIPAQSLQPDAAFAPVVNEEEPTQFVDVQAVPSSSSTQDQSLEPPAQPEATNEGAVDYQSLLDNIVQSASTAPAGDSLTATITEPPDVGQIASSLPSNPGLPPKPPPQITNSGDKLSQVNHPIPALDPVNLQQAQQDAYPAPGVIVTQSSEGGMHANGVASSSMLYHTPADNSYPTPIDTIMANTQQLSDQASAPGDRPWTPNTQKVYDNFLEAERGYVTEGIWDKFPNGSRLFVGNLASEKVTKRDLFHIFHRHGRLAQISIKQAYGFVQFLESTSCHAALQAEQGSEIRGRKIHLEVSKPQKNTRGAGAAAVGAATNKPTVRRRSRSPERGRSSLDRHPGRPSFSEHQNDPGRRRDGFRSPRSVSPRNYRSRDDYRSAQSPRRHPFQDSRPRSPAFPAFPAPFPTPSYDEDAALPIPRRDPRDVPDVQLLILDPSVAPPFINWVEQALRSKGLKASTVWLNSRLPLQAVVKRQIIEGVQAIIKLIQNSQYTGKIPLQVFDRSGGASNVNFNEYVDLDVAVAADIVLHARNKERNVMQPSPQVYHPPRPSYQPPTPYGNYAPQQSPHQYSPNGPPQQHYQQHSPTGPPQYHQQRPGPPQQTNSFPYQAQQQQAPQHFAPSTPTAGTPNLQQLLANLGQTSNSPVRVSVPPVPPGQRQADIGGLLSNIAARQQNQAQQYNAAPQPPPLPHQQGYPLPNAQQAYGPGSNVQNIMDQLARYQR